MLATVRRINSKFRSWRRTSTIAMQFTVDADDAENSLFFPVKCCDTILLLNDILEQNYFEFKI